MKTQLRFLCGLCALSFLSFGCEGGAVGEGTFTTISPTDAEGLARGCDVVLDSADDRDLSFARVAGNELAVVVEGPDGSCLDGPDHVLAILGMQNRVELAAHIAANFHAADPSPHPDLNDVGAADPSPHPDKSTGTASADPSPHPDTPTDDDDDTFTVAILVPIDTGGGTGGSTAPPAPAPPTAGKDD